MAICVARWKPDRLIFWSCCLLWNQKLTNVHNASKLVTQTNFLYCWNVLECVIIDLFYLITIQSQSSQLTESFKSFSWNFLNETQGRSQFDQIWKLSTEISGQMFEIPVGSGMKCFDSTESSRSDEIRKSFESITVVCIRQVLNDPNEVQLKFWIDSHGWPPLNAGGKAIAIEIRAKALRCLRIIWLESWNTKC